MSDRGYPILVRRLDATHPATLAICTECYAEEDWDPTGISPYDASCDHCGGEMAWKYEEADPCPNCGKLGFWDKALNRCCSRPCMLQAEWAATLAARRGQGGV